MLNPGQGIQSCQCSGREAVFAGQEDGIAIQSSIGGCRQSVREVQTGGEKCGVAGDYLAQFFRNKPGRVKAVASRQTVHPIHRIQGQERLSLQGGQTFEKFNCRFDDFVREIILLGVNLGSIEAVSDHADGALSLLEKMAEIFRAPGCSGQLYAF